eukprot:SM000056S17940  [mRNA]  locus=s56:205920:210628:+ [translate_table: standard]
MLCPYEGEDPAFRRAGRLPNLRYGDQTRALWVTRYDFRTAADVAEVVANAADAGFNHVFFQARPRRAQTLNLNPRPTPNPYSKPYNRFQNVRGNGTAHYASRVEPWSEVYDYRSPGFDPLALALREAHARNMALHAWVNVMPMWRGLHPPTCPDQLYNSHPEWSWYDKQGVRQPLNKGFYVSLNPCLPEARRHIVDVCRDLVGRYQLDGLHLDYIRFPNELPVLNGREYSQDKRTLELFRLDTGLSSPEACPEVWDQWRCDSVTALLRDIRRAAKSIRPQLVLTAAVGVERRQALSKFQDVETWWKERLLDAVVPMNYTGCHKTYRARVEREWRMGVDRSTPPMSAADPRRHFFRKKYLQDRHGPRQLVEESTVTKQWAAPPQPAVIMGSSLDHGDTTLHQKQLMLALQRFGHFAVFCYSSLFKDPVQPAVKKGKRQGAVQQRREVLVPFLQVLARASHVLSPAAGSLRVAAQPFQSSVHPEESVFAFDQLKVIAVAPGVLAEAGAGKRVARTWGAGVGGRRIAAPDGEIVKLRRRTWRRKLLMEERQKEAMWDGVVHEQSTMRRARERRRDEVFAKAGDTVCEADAVKHEGRAMPWMGQHSHSHGTLRSVQGSRNVRSGWVVGEGVHWEAERMSAAVQAGEAE